MNKMRTILLASLLVCPSALWAASTSTWPMAPMEPNLQDLPSLQNGFRLYVNEHGGKLADKRSKAR